MIVRQLRLFFAFILILFTQTAKGQYYITGDNPARAKWNYISGRNYKVIYPTEIDSLAQTYLWLLEKNRNAVLCGLKVAPKKISVVLNPYTASSNGVVVWAPKRMELYTQAPNSTYAQNWKEQLVLHETRHVGQISLFTSKIFKPAYWILGEQAVGLGVAIYPSRWFFEGDAVLAETELSKSGRGRSASFLGYYRASFLQNEHKSWNRWRYGSNKYYTPDIYALGYITSSAIRYSFGNYYFAGDFLSYLVRTPYNPFNFDIIYKRLGKVQYTQSIEMAHKVMGKIWQEENEKRGTFSQPEAIGKIGNQKDYYNEYSQTTCYNYNKYYLRKSYDRATSLVSIDSTDKEKFLRPFAGSAKMKEIGNNKIYFTELVPHERWQKKTYNMLFSYDLSNGKIKRIGSKTSYFSPTLSSNEDSLVVIENLINGDSRLVGIDANTGKELFKILAPMNGQLTGASWHNNTIYVTAISSKGLGIFAINIKDIENNAWQRVINEQHSSINSLSSYKDFIYFVSDIDGVDNIYAFYPSSNIIRRLSNSAYGASSPYVYNETLLYSQLELNGIKPVKLDLKDSSKYNNSQYTISLKEGNLESNYKYIVADELSRQANEALKENSFKLYSLDDKQDFEKVEPKPYHKFLDLFRVHSWGPLYYNVDKIMNMSFEKIYQVVSLGATVYSQNTLGTAVTMLGYSYRKGFHAGHLKFTYTGLYPVFELSTDINAENRFRLKLSTTDKKTKLEILSSPLIETSLRAYIPFNFSSHGWNRGLIPQLMWDFENNEYYRIDGKEYNYKNQINYTLQYYQTRPIAPAAIFPKWGFGIVARGVSAINGGQNFGGATSLYLYGYVPGVLPRQGLRLAIGVEKQYAQGKNYYLNNLLKSPRGYDFRLYGKDYGISSLDYAIPLYLGDINLTSMLYLQRLDITPFVDFALCNEYDWRNRTSHWRNYYSYGVDVMLRGIFFRISTPIGIGLRYAKNGNNSSLYVKKNYFEFLFNVSI